MEVTVIGEPKEIAALVVALQGRQKMYPVKVKVDTKEIIKAAFEARRDTPQECDT